jgi:Stage II sporulation protein E (SpoIIE)
VTTTTASVGMAKLIDAYDWDGTIGSRSRWPLALRITVDIALASGFPMLVFWGPNLVQIYNDAFVPILGARHSAALGQTAESCWPEIWDTIGPLLLGVLETGEPVWAEDLPLVLERNGYPEQTYFTFSYSRICDEGGANGLLCTCVETTKSALRQSYVRDHAVSLAFQDAALPRTLPTVPGLAFDAMYEAAGEDALVGGDWYDAFVLPDGRVVISVGDVGGNGLEAAVTMGAVRQTIRGAAQVFAEPAAALDAADRALRSEQPDRIVTAFVGILDPLTLALSYASAGHPPPLLRHGDGSLVELDAIDLPLGLRNERTAGSNHVTTLSQSALLVLYTDGLTEATRNVLEGEKRLRDALARDDIVRSARPAAAIRRAVAGEASDDVAILTVRVGPASLV